MATVEQAPTTTTTTEEAAAAEQAGGTTTPPTSSGPVLALLMYTPSAPPGQPPNAPQRPHDRATSKVIGKRKLLGSPSSTRDDSTQRASEEGKPDELNDFRLDAETGGATGKLPDAEIKAAKLSSE